MQVIRWTSACGRAVQARDGERDRHMSQLQSGEMDDSNRSVWDAQLRHPGRRPGKVSQSKWHLSCVLNPNQEEDRAPRQKKP